MTSPIPPLVELAVDLPRPAAFLGLTAGPRPMARICGWCETRKAAEMYADAAGLECSHAMCPACQKKFFPEIDFNK